MYTCIYKKYRVKVKNLDSHQHKVCGHLNDSAYILPKSIRSSKTKIGSEYLFFV